MRIPLVQDSVHGIRSHESTAEKNQGSNNRALSSDQSDIASDTLDAAGLDVSFANVTFSINGAENLILDSVSGKVQKGTLLGILGPSGSGKCGGKSLRKFKALFGYVPQDDIVHPHLTVWENILYSARIRLGDTLNDRDIQNLVHQVIFDLELDRVKDSVVGNQEHRGISGGERKRVSIGLELIAAPPVLVLDEPTSGLDAQSALSLILLLKSLSRKGISVICVIHQPRIEIFESLDSVLLLGSGKTVYFGPQSGTVQYFRNMGHEFEPRLNPADIIMDIVSGDGQISRPSIKGDIFKETSITQLLRSTTNEASESGNYKCEALLSLSHSYENRFATWYMQIYLAFCRDLRQQSRTASSILLEIAAGSLCGMLIGLSIYEFQGHIYQGIYIEPFQMLSSAVDYALVSQLGTLSCLATSFAAAAPSVIVFSVEKLVFYRESYSGHSEAAYFSGKLLTSLLRSTISALHFSTFYTILATPVISFGQLLGFNILYFYCVYGLGSIIAALTDSENGPLFSLLLNIVVAIFGGASPRLAIVKTWHLEWFWYMCPGLWFSEAFFSAHASPFSYLYDSNAAESFTGYKIGRTGFDIGPFARLLVLIETAADDPLFTFPPASGTVGEIRDDLGFTVGQSITLTWNLTSDEALAFWLVQDNPNQGSNCVIPDVGAYLNQLCSEIAADVPNNGSLPWNVSRLGMQASDIYFITAHYGSEGSKFNTHYINITDASPSAPTSTTSSVSPISTPTSYTSSSSPLPSHSSTPSKPVGAIIGGVIGGVAGVVIISVLAFLLYKARRKQKQDETHQGLHSTPHRWSEPTEDVWKPGPHISSPEMQDSSRQRYEMPS
ncbi:ABC transporter G family member 43 [Talaromyces islandicus]|uniref:ABC transporter G family member 43 n=1 Tax=Talaromyces islandicus TaxID=28573 RepID=A0A0U1LJ59_TALIS|nr:ABC transporter G family member 43 [Talaromyces islandicus]